MEWESKDKRQSVMEALAFLVEGAKDAGHIRAEEFGEDVREYLEWLEERLEDAAGQAFERDLKAD